MARPDPLLLDLARGDSLSAPGEPTKLIRSAIEHRMAGLLWTAVDEGRLELDAESRAALVGYVLPLRAQLRQIREALDEVARRMAPLGIELATFKGATAAARWYDRDGERLYSDLDLLIGPQDLPRAAEIAEAIEPGHRLSGVLQALVDRRALQSVDLVMNGVAIDLHFDMLKFDVPSRQLEVLWSHTEPYSLPSGESIRVFDAEATLVHLLLHLNKDRFRYLLGHVDVARLIEREQLDWPVVYKLMRGDGLEVPLTLTLEAAAEALRVELPSHLAPRGWRAALWRRLWPEGIRLQGDLGFMRLRNRQRWLPLLARGRMFDGVRAYFQYLMPPPELMDYHFGNTTGPYWRRNVEGRLRHFLTRRHGSALLERGATLGEARFVEEPSGASDAVGLGAADQARLLRRSAAENAPLWIPVDGASMGQTIRAGARVLLDASVERPSRGEIWAFCDDHGRVVVHRSIGARRGLQRFQGDAVADPDPPVAGLQLIARVSAVEDGSNSRLRSRRAERAGYARIFGRNAARAIARKLPSPARNALRRALGR